MKDIRITEDCLVKGEHTPAGTVLKSVDNAFAAELLTSGRAVLVEKRAAKTSVPQVETRDPVVETRDPEPEAKPKAKK